MGIGGSAKRGEPVIEEMAEVEDFFRQIDGEVVVVIGRLEAEAGILTLEVVKGAGEG